MLARMRKRHTEEIIHRKNEIFKEADNPLSYQEAMDILLQGEPQAAVMLRGLRNREGMTQAELGMVLGINQANISKMELGKRSIGKTIAKRIAKLFKTDYRLFL